MGDRRRARTYVSLAAVAFAHAGLFLLLSLTLAPALTLTAPDVVVAPVYLARLEPRRPPPDERPRSAPLRARISPRPAPPQIAALPIPAPVAPPAPAPTSQADADRARLAGSLRASRAGCATPHLLTEKERARCERQLADGAKEAKYVPVPLPKERRAYYDAIAKAKSHERASLPVIPGETRVPDPSAGQNKGGSLAALQLSNEEIRIPIFGCKYTFGGPGGGVWKPPVGLKLGPLPCYVTPPQGPLTIDAHIQNPDKVVKKKD